MSDLFSGIANVAKQVTSNISTYEIRKLKDKAMGLVSNFSEAEGLVFEATNEDPWGPTGPQMKEIAHLTYQYDLFYQVMLMLWKRMLEDNKHAWRRVYKSLTLLNYLLQHGSERGIADAKDHIYQMRSLEHYKLIDEKGKDQGVNIRHRAKIILDLLGDEDKLRAERLKAKGDNKDRYQGFTPDEIKMGRGGAYDGNGSSKSSSSDWRSNKRRDSFEDDKVDYSAKECNDFQFPDAARRGSLSPELGFRNEPSSNTNSQMEDDDGFGDFASARSAAKPKSGGLNFKIATTAPPIAPPPSSGGIFPRQSQTSPQAQFDLLSGFEGPTPAASAEPAADTDFFSSNQAPQVNTAKLTRPPRPPSGGSAAAAGDLDIFGSSAQPPAAVLSPPSATANSASLISTDDLFGSVATPQNQTANGTANLIDDWSGFNSGVPAANFSLAPPQQQSTGFADFSGSVLSSNPLQATSPNQNTPTDNLTDLFGNMGPISPVQVEQNNMSNQSSTVNSDPKASNSKANIGSTWAGTSGLIDFDNLASKPTNTKQSLTLNQMQAMKGWLIF
ncbi:hypothetical protein WR25_24253 isoform A [Diploscapter pachys]|uniref:ENTH domain-containing protein n=1 Tax=Diploscapter pachys TaxID=2018661 RepID=A0A2A2LK55_9BILA|nr:hypothetical protein WR25_24253 isoform A [Diploscapter pachys]